MLGVIGGIGPESTIEYYRANLAAYPERHATRRTPVLINSSDVKRLLGLVDVNDLAGLTTYLMTELRRLAAGGASLAILAADTPHIVFDDVAKTPTGAKQRTLVERMLATVAAAPQPAAATRIIRT